MKNIPIPYLWKFEVLVDNFILFSRRARREGLLSLEKELSSGNIDDDLIRLGLGLVCDGTDPELVRSILSEQGRTRLRAVDRFWVIWKFFLLNFDAANLRDSLELLPRHHEGTIDLLLALREADPGNEALDRFREHRFTARCLEIRDARPPSPEFYWNAAFDEYKTDLDVTGRIIIDGILSIQSGDHPTIVEARLKSIAGIPFDYPGDFTDPGNPPADGSLSQDEIDALLNFDDEDDRPDPALDRDFERTILALPADFIQRHQALFQAEAFRDCNPETIEHIVKNLGARSRLEVLEILHIDSPRPEFIQNARLAIIRRLLQLERQGLLVLEAPD